MRVTSRTQPALPRIDPLFLELAAAMMNDEGKLGPKPTEDQQPKAPPNG